MSSQYVRKKRHRDARVAEQARDNQSYHSEDAVGRAQVAIPKLLPEFVEGSYHEREQLREDVIVTKASDCKSLGENHYEEVGRVLGRDDDAYRVRGKRGVADDGGHRATPTRIGKLS